MMCEFTERMRLYVQWDQRLMHCTRFFGAAALTNSMLSELQRHAGLWISGSSLQFLRMLGRQLLAVNIRVAQQLDAGQFQAADLHGRVDADLHTDPSAHLDGDVDALHGDLDARIVGYEQAVVEEWLARLRRADAHHVRRVITELDRLLAMGSWSLSLAGSTVSSRAYAAVLRSVIGELGRSPRFAGCGDRVRIGYGLVRYLRRDLPAAELARACLAGGRPARCCAAGTVVHS